MADLEFVPGVSPSDNADLESKQWCDVPLALLEVSALGEIRDANRAWQGLLACRAESLPGRSIVEIVTTDSRNRLFRELEAVVSGNGSREFQLWLRAVDGSRIPVRAWLDRSGRTTACLSVRRYAPTEILVEPAGAATASGDEVPARVRGDLRTLLGLLALDERTAREPAARRALRSTGRRLRAVNEAYSPDLMSDSSRMSADRLALAVTRGLTRGQPLDRSVRLDLALASVSIDPRDAVALALIVSELVSNALDHGLPNGSGRLRLSLSTLGDRFQLRVEDDGARLNPEMDLDQLDTMGMQIVAGLTERLGGVLDYRVDGWSIFSVTLPLASR